MDLKSASQQRVQAGFVSGGVQKVAQDDGNSDVACFKRPSAQRVVEMGLTRGRELGQSLEKGQARLASTHGAERSSKRPFVGTFRERDDTHTIESTEGNISNRRCDLAGKIEFPWLSESHGFTRIQKDANWQLALLLVKFQEET